MDQLQKNLQEILDKSYEAIYVTDMEYNILYANKGARAMSKALMHEEIEGKKCYECLLHAKEPCSFCKVGQLEKDVFTTRTFHAERWGRYYELRGQLLDWHGIPAHIEFIRDITEQAKAERQLEISEERFRLVVEQSRIALVDYNLQTREAYINPGFERYACADGSQIRDYMEDRAKNMALHPEDQPEFQRLLNEAKESGADTVSTKLRLLMKDGSWHWTEVNILFLRNDRGEIIRELGFLVDVDEATRKYEGLKTRYDYETARQNSFDDGVVERITMDLTTGQIVGAANADVPVLAQLVGKKIDELLEMRLSRTKDEEHRRQFRKFFDREYLLESYYKGEKPGFESTGPVHGSQETDYFKISANFAKNPNN